MTMEKIIIAAVADNMAIGKGNALLWHISEDLKFFKKTTSGYPVIMGRKTFESIGRPLPKRPNIIVTRTGQYDGAVTAASLEEAFRIAGDYPAPATDGDHTGKKCFIIGGGQIYRHAIGMADRLLLTHVHVTVPDADTFFPEISPEEWKETSRSETFTDPESGYRFEFTGYERRR